MDNLMMQCALEEADKAISEDEIPIGAVLVKSGEIILRDHNRTRQLQDPLAHAEKLIIDKIIGSGIKYLYDFTLYVTLEPCLMCAGMMIWSRLGTIVYGARDPKAGAVGSIYNVLADKSFNHHPVIRRDVLHTECSEILRAFFKSKR
ncbi:MAG: cytosine deaminase [Candidatus Cloacimonetes bacterium HGW-Cloacimonetes-1]|nr:MAG: cytosine deaminase [Candidatus Cloacimonetes bacterium HGW-Cloacimonetes-1]